MLVLLFKLFSIVSLVPQVHGQCYTPSKFCGTLAVPRGCYTFSSVKQNLPSVYSYCTSNDAIVWKNGVTGGSSSAGKVVDFNFLICKEGFTTCGYVPLACCTRNSACGTILGISGTTIGAGVDLGQYSPHELVNAGVPLAIRNKVAGYIGKKSTAGANYVCNNFLRLTQAETMTLTEAMHGYFAKGAERDYNSQKAASKPSWMSLPLGIRTAVVSVRYQYGPAGSPKFWSYIVANNWQMAINELRNWSPRGTPLRLKQTANIIEAALNGGSNPVAPPGGGGGGSGTATGARIQFPSSSLEVFTSSSSNYNDPNNMGTKLFSKSAAGLNTKLSTNFVVKEFVSGGGEDLFRLAPLIVSCVQAVRTAIAAPLTIVSGYRSVSFNQQQGGSAGSYHLSGTSADLSTTAMSLTQLGKRAACTCGPMFKAAGFGMGAGLASTFVQIEFRKTSGVASWTEAGAAMTSANWRSLVTGCGSNGGGNGGGANPQPPPSGSNCVRFPSGACLKRWTPGPTAYRDPNGSGTPLFNKNTVGVRTKVSANFIVGEFVSKNGAAGFRLSPKLIECLQAVRNKVGKPIRINSGYRSPAHNAGTRGSASKSRHMSGTAADVSPPAGMSSLTFSRTVICTCQPIFVGNGQNIGTGLDPYYIHVDMRPSLGTWTYPGAPLTRTGWYNRVVSTIRSCGVSAGAFNNANNDGPGAAGTYETPAESQMIHAQMNGNSTQASSSGGASGIGGAAIAGIVLGLVGCLVVAAAAMYCVKKKKRDEVNAIAFGGDKKGDYAPPLLANDERSDDL